MRSKSLRCAVTTQRNSTRNDSGFQGPPDRVYASVAWEGAGRGSYVQASIPARYLISHNPRAISSGGDYIRRWASSCDRRCEQLSERHDCGRGRTWFYYDHRDGRGRGQAGTFPLDQFVSPTRIGIDAKENSIVNVSGGEVSSVFLNTNDSASAQSLDPSRPWLRLASQPWVHAALLSAWKHPANGVLRYPSLRQ